jgi:hypothetical protein
MSKPRHRPQITDIESAEMRQMRADGMTIRAVADKFDRGVGAVRKHTQGVTFPEKRQRWENAGSEPTEPVLSEGLPQAAPIDTSDAPPDWHQFWFTLTPEVRATIEHHLETCQSLLELAKRIDVTDRSQFPAWKQLRTESGWGLTNLGAAIKGVDRTQIGRYENGQRIPTGNAATTYKALLVNLLGDRYHHHLVRLTWHLWHAHEGTRAPEVVDPTPEFMTWTHDTPNHPLLSKLPHSLMYDRNLDWPLKVSAA